MSGEITTTITGNITRDIQELNTGGSYGASFTVASTKRRWNKQAGNMSDAGTVFMNCVAWGDLAQHIIQTVSKGNRVIVTGELEQRSYTDKQGNNRSSIQLIVHDLGPSLMWATAQINRIQTPNSGFAGNRPQNGNFTPQQNAYQTQQQYNNFQQADQFGQLNSGYSQQAMQQGQSATDIWGRPQNQLTQPAQAATPVTTTASTPMGNAEDNGSEPEF
ncbi:single-stranded DNA-binding protein [Bifidobacterium sp. SO1]|uniref:single-stranded DNA-binding protein n=1 Tax=Bifidobacterium sp. SO1 TaxID=2809029 RepID=UPI001BDCB016|nr:single-stranded DNA-binding protein [Bifidobacterium sp. SO1]MBT1162097.1 single-stranded DNA-binding protein [Bifidobacterium sp. SO1]